MVRIAVIVSCLALCASAVLAKTTPVGEVAFDVPQGPAFGGVGFQNAEAEITALMPDDFRDQRVLKSFREISPTFARVYAGFADCPREQADRFADYYDATFRKAGTELYAVGGMMPFVAEDETEAYAEKVAANLEYLIKVRGCTNIRHYCMTNELGIDGRGDWYFNRMERFRQIHAALRAAFDRHGLQDVGLAATDVNNHVAISLRQLDWATKNMDDVTSVYCTHWYMFLGRTKDGKSILPSSSENAATMRTHFSSLVAKAAEKGKRYFVGEFGLWTPSTQGANRIMHDDTGYPLRAPEHAAEGAITLAEIALTAMNEGAYAAASWSFVDYPDPFVFEPGDTPEEDAIYQSARCVYWPDRKYNKWGVFRWDSVDRDYGAYPSLYTMGWMAKLFRRGARVMKARVSDDTLRAGGVANPDGSASFAVINWGEAKTVSLSVPHLLTKPLRVYEYDSARPPVNAFNDLQPSKGVVSERNGTVTISVPARSMTFLTTDYKDRVPAAIAKMRIADGLLAWKPNKEPEHRYYRVYRDGKQIASTVATSLPVPGAKPKDAARFAVTGVDRWGNEGVRGKCAAPGKWDSYLSAMERPDPVSGVRRFRLGGIREKVYYDAQTPLEDGSRCSLAVVMIHGWHGGIARLKAQATLIGAFAKRSRSGEDAPYVIAPFFPHHSIVDGKFGTVEGLAIWNKSWEKERGANATAPRRSASDDWRGGGDAVGTALSSYDVVDRVFAELGDRRRFPNLRKVVLTGFSAGGQFAGRYAAVGKGFVRDGVKVAYVAMAPSTELRFDPDTKWHYGLKNRPRYSAALTEGEIMANLSSRRVWRGCGSKDVLQYPRTPLDSSAEAMAQGTNRLDRFMKFREHLNGFPEWSRQVSFHVFDGVGHNSVAAYGDPSLLAYLLEGTGMED